MSVGVALPLCSGSHLVSPSLTEGGVVVTAREVIVSAGGLSVRSTYLADLLWQSLGMLGVDGAFY